MPELPRKPLQESQIDHLLAEEFSCDPGFCNRFTTACRLGCEEWQVFDVVPEPSLGGRGYGDLLVKGQSTNEQIMLLIENKITAAPATRQAERYNEFAKQQRSDGWDRVWTILIAPSSYQGERDEYDANLDMETLINLFNSAEPKRLDYRRQVVRSAIEKKEFSGVRIPDPAMLQLKRDYIDFFKKRCHEEDFRLRFPAIKDEYYDGDSWIENIRRPELPKHMSLRHRLWTSSKNQLGQVDLIATPANDSERQFFFNTAPVDAIVSDYSKGKGVQISIPLPEMRQQQKLDKETSERAFYLMKRLIHWHLWKN